MTKHEEKLGELRDEKAKGNKLQSFPTYGESYREDRAKPLLEVLSKRTGDKGHNCSDQTGGRNSSWLEWSVLEEASQRGWGIPTPADFWKSAGPTHLQPDLTLQLALLCAGYGTG